MMSNNKEDNIGAARQSEQALEFLTFTLGKEEYGIDIQSVQELRSYETVTQMANAPAYIKGVVNLRGVIVPIIDMRIKFGLGNATYDQFTVVVILNVYGSTLGIVVDSVSDVIALTAEQIKPAPQMGATIATDYMTGLGTLDERMLILVDIEKLMASPEMGLVVPRLAA
jgi:purine-binding chemotaxis protein CheW